MNETFHGAPPRRFDQCALPALVAGIIFLCAFDDFGGFILAVIPGIALLATGTSLLLWPGTPKITQFMALGAVLGVVLAIPEIFVTGPAYGIILLILSAMSFACAGRAGLRLAARFENEPPAPDGWKAAVKAGVDEALMGYFVGTAQLPSGERAVALCSRFERMQGLLASAAWGDPRKCHKAPPAPEDATLESTKAGGMTGQRLRFTSGYEPPPGMPDVPHWLKDADNSRCSALVFRHEENGRPWLLGIHGYRMGSDWLNTSMLPPRVLSKKDGYNLVLPVLPLHGARKVGWRSGDYYLDGQLLDFIFAQAQALWDLRRTIAWIRAEEPDARIGVMGFSLGGFNTALLAAHEPGLDFCIAGIPLAEPAALLWSVLPKPYQDYFSAHGIDPAHLGKLMKLVSPLALPPRLDAERLAIFAGTADRVVPPDQPMRLSRHWDVPVRWYPGGHLTFRGESVVMGSLHEMAAMAGWNEKMATA